MSGRNHFEFVGELVSAKDFPWKSGKGLTREMTIKTKEENRNVATFHNVKVKAFENNSSPRLRASYALGTFLFVSGRITTNTNTTTNKEYLELRATDYVPQEVGIPNQAGVSQPGGNYTEKEPVTEIPAPRDVLAQPFKGEIPF